jgi:adenylate cyclase
MREDTAIGDTVNMAARIEGLTRRFECSELASEATRALAGDAFLWTQMEPSLVRGKPAPVITFQPRAARPA